VHGEAVALDYGLSRSSEPFIASSVDGGSAAGQDLRELYMALLRVKLDEVVAGNATQRRRAGPLRVCHLAYTFYENDSRVIRYAERLIENGHSVDVFALRGPGQASRQVINGVRVYRIQKRSVGEKRSISYLLKLSWFAIKSTCFLLLSHLRQRYDLIHVHNIPDFLVFAALLPKVAGAKIILDIHDIVPELYAAKFGDPRGSLVFRILLAIESLSCRVADHVIVANPIWQKRMAARASIATKSTTMINYPDLRRFDSIRSARPSKNGRFTILYPGSLNRHQGLDIAVRAVAAIGARIPALEFKIHGDGPARQELVELISRLGVSDRVRLFPAVSQEQIAAIISAADVGVVPKRAEGFGDEAFSTKTLEFMAAGVPVVISRTSIDSYYFDESLVRFFEPGNSEDLAVALVELYEEARHTVSSRAILAREFAQRNSWQRHCVDYDHIVNALAHTAPPNHS
jgi:glycosyltransferase involved in cell wall biosynthesis